MSQTLSAPILTFVSGSINSGKSTVSRCLTEMYQTNLYNPGFGVRIDNSEQTPMETAEVILRHLDSNR